MAHLEVKFQRELNTALPLCREYLTEGQAGDVVAIFEGRGLPGVGRIDHIVPDPEPWKISFLALDDYAARWLEYSRATVVDISDVEEAERALLETSNLTEIESKAIPLWHVRRRGSRVQQRLRGQERLRVPGRHSGAIRVSSRPARAFVSVR
jgi:hypothetical protein